MASDKTPISDVYFAYRYLKNKLLPLHPSGSSINTISLSSAGFIFPSFAKIMSYNSFCHGNQLSLLSNIFISFPLYWLVLSLRKIVFLFNFVSFIILLNSDLSIDLHSIISSLLSLSNSSSFFFVRCNVFFYLVFK